MHRPAFTINADSRQCESGSRGFTLIEVLIALAVIAIGLLAVLSVAAKSTHVATDLQQRNFANWIAQNQIARLRLAPDWPELGTSNDSVDFANQRWHYQIEVVKTSAKALRRVNLSVALADNPDEIITRLVGFIGKPVADQVALPAPATGQQAQAASTQ